MVSCCLLLSVACGFSPDSPPPPPLPVVARADAHPEEATWPEPWLAAPAGVSATLSLATAPFPHGDRPYGDPSVFVFVPAAALSADRVDLVLHYHGFEGLLERLVPDYRLTEQVAASGRPAVLVVPQGPVMARDGDFGKLMLPGGVQQLLDEVWGRLVEGGLRAERGGLVLSVHSGGYRAAARALDHGGVPVEQVLLFDALYGELDSFQRWVEAGGRLRSVHTEKGGTRGANLRLRERLVAAGVEVADAGRVVVAATEAGHNECLAEGGLADALR